MAGPWLSIITVVKDDASGFEETLASIGTQALDGVELVVLDGSLSREDTPAALVRAACPVSTTYAWEPPAGVYPAMNSALESAAGEYCYFLNAGDQFHGKDAVAAIKAVIDTHSPAWLYGQVCFIDELGLATTPPMFNYFTERASLFSGGRFPPHQGTVARTELLQSIGGFDTSYRVAADYAAFLRLSQAADPAECREVLAVFQHGGLSSTAWRDALAEFHRARQEILRPKGINALRERASTSRQLIEALIYHGLVGPIRRVAARHNSGRTV
jgi:glycosyltransferase